MDFLNDGWAVAMLGLTGTLKNPFGDLMHQFDREACYAHASPHGRCHGNRVPIVVGMAIQRANHRVAGIRYTLMSQMGQYASRVRFIELFLVLVAHRTTLRPYAVGAYLPNGKQIWYGRMLGRTHLKSVAK